MSLNIKGLPAFSDNYIWLIEDREKGIAICIDPGDPQVVESYLMANHLTLESILVTHHHVDHIGGIETLATRYPKCTILGPQDPRIPALTSNVDETDVCTFANLGLTFNVIFTPGHTLSHVCYYEPNQCWLFSGDTLFSGGCGRLFEGSPEQMLNSLEKLASLPEKTLVYCAHEYTRNNLAFALSIEPSNSAIEQHIQALAKPEMVCSLPSTIGLEKQINPFLRTTSSSIKKQLQRMGKAFENEIACFATLRALKDQY